MSTWLQGLVWCLAFCPILLVSAQSCSSEKCLERVEYCDSYDSTCAKCEDICLPPTNSKFEDCSANCGKFLQDVLIEHWKVGTNADLDTVEVLLAVITAVTLVTLLVVVALAISWKMAQNNANPYKCDVMPLSQIQNSGSVRTISTRISEERNIRSPPHNSVNGYAQSNRSTNSRIPSEDRAPSYENPAMIPSPTLPPLREDISNEHQRSRRIV